MRNQHSCYEHEVTFGDGNSHRFEILDLSDCRRIDEKAEKQFEEHIKWGDVFFLMFSITGTQFYNSQFGDEMSPTTILVTNLANESLNI